ncbi:MAG: hypothetical protein ACQEWV_10730 [Bacillota bacterium]
MQLAEYIGKTDLEIIHFSLSLIKDIDLKIKSKTFYYKNQVLTYINNCVDYFLNTLHVKCSLLSIYKAEIHQMINIKLKKVYAKHSLLSCV